jgi:hypothetical protein
VQVPVSLRRADTLVIPTWVNKEGSRAPRGSADRESIRYTGVVRPTPDEEQRLYLSESLSSGAVEDHCVTREEIVAGMIVGGCRGSLAVHAGIALARERPREDL